MKAVSCTGSVTPPQHPAINARRQRNGMSYWPMLGTALLMILGLGESLPATAQSQPAPVYQAVPCCQLCPQAADPASYNTKYLEFFSTLFAGEDGWLFRTENDLRTDFGPDEEGYQSLRRFSAALKRKGVDLVLVYQPPRGLVNTERMLPIDRANFDFDLARQNYVAALDRFRAQGIWVPDLSPLLDEHEDHPFFFRGDHHWTPYGAQRTAKLVADTIKSIPAYADIPRKAFVTHRSGLLGKRGTLHKAAAQICGNGYPDQYVDRFTTEPAEESSLLGDDSAPEIALVGTSNSESTYNFDGALEQDLSADILNEAVTGGGYDGGLLQYLPSDDFQEHPPKILVWEFETHYDLSKPMFYRQVLPLIDNGCQGQKPELSATVTLHPGSNQLLFNGGARILPIKGGSHVLDIQFADHAVHQFRAVVWYMNGRKESIKFDHSNYVDTQGRFVVSLRADPDWANLTFLSLEIISDDSAPVSGEVSAQMCTQQAEDTANSKQEPVL